MARVVLLVTGRMEEMAFADALNRLFPGHTFVPRPRLDGFTSARLPPDEATLASKRARLLNLNKFANTLIGAFAPGRRADTPPADFVVALEDVELLNAHDPGAITRALRDALCHRLADWGLSLSTEQRVRGALRERCSFHLMAPMTEAYFFADRHAFARSTAPGPDHPNVFPISTCDVESFHVDDPQYRTPPNRPGDTWATDNRTEHPKHYLEYLTDPALDDGFRYHETTLGADALRHIDWLAVLRSQPAGARFARSLLTDLADMLDELPAGFTHDDLASGRCHPLTWPPPKERVLRNL